MLVVSYGCIIFWPTDADVGLIHNGLFPEDLLGRNEWCHKKKKIKLKVIHYASRLAMTVHQYNTRALKLVNLNRMQQI